MYICIVYVLLNEEYCENSNKYEILNNCNEAIINIIINEIRINCIKKNYIKFTHFDFNPIFYRPLFRNMCCKIL